MGKIDPFHTIKRARARRRFIHNRKEKNYKAFLNILRRFLRSHGRPHLPWRKTKDPYRILVSEVMLQQTQVERVTPYYRNFLKHFSTPERLARASLSQVLGLWQGLGYNRRAKYLHLAAKAIVAGGFPRAVRNLEKLPGVGHYTARAVAAFAFNASELFVETNIRTALLHHFFPRARRVSDARLLPLIEEALRRSRMEPRRFYAALMDYGAHLKRTGVRLNARSSHYVKQGKFEGSPRQLRGAIVREVLRQPRTVRELMKNLSRRRGEVERELARLEREELLTRAGNRFLA